ncbi:hypothetical protein TSUD_383030 [Trifolium subterraneum]|uniref:Replication factor A C-terminal domain-containing protein n=1 Tax=Trifolium subterraneum TaxID=3900 RepID=A0A2Z6MB75_TRISU|nr:hypothetical protein TSUD_383030 [Trifolium subterraneum]
MGKCAEGFTVVVIQFAKVMPRFKVKIEVSDCNSKSVFILFDSDMSYLLEKSCAYFVAQAKSSNGVSYPVEFEALIDNYQNRGQRKLDIIVTTPDEVKTSAANEVFPATLKRNLNN